MYTCMHNHRWYGTLPIERHRRRYPWPFDPHTQETCATRVLTQLTHPAVGFRVHMVHSN